ncbi:hypothetical protein E1B28_012638 [Marasmius oreades]|uniref:Structural maintenance of chromosomes protein n=1 Tax=Marasmius oreades TaxID=181124 RepID=A0A9P7UQ50_9AGAR|nr:uncharacterized protein E1B28_012638 [Marasmius oreades]KAG7088666.1 hypothetical protein E1B28_012638 [Marasmius oreades]
MHIKTLTIQGFKSYRDQAQIESFSPRHNVVVGRNGSGKSNFFAAIRFVLSDAYTSMSQEERQSLLHEGVSTTTTLSAYVEIIFDNSDNRFLTGNNEVIIRRTIGLKKVESAGFSKSNPYYIVPQGRITALTNAKDHERLALLKEVAGTKVYEQRRTESLKIMAETEAKRTKINELLDYIESRLTELEEEKEELKEFQEKDKERRCLEYALYQRELGEVGEALEEIEEDRRTEVHGANIRREKFNEREKEIQDLEKSISETRHALEASNITKQDTRFELTEMIRSRTALECVVNDLRNAGLRSKNKRKGLELELTTITETITSRETSLDALLPDWESVRSQESTEKRKLDEASAKLSALFAKQGRVTKFRTKAERDTFLKQEIRSMQSHTGAQNEALDMTRSELENAKTSRLQIEREIAAVQGKIEDGRQKVAELSLQASTLREKHAELVEERKDKWREDTKLESLVGRAAEEMRSSERILAGMMDKDTGTGLRAVDRIAERYKLRGVHGPMYRLFEVTDPKFNIAVELTAGNSLFHVVVDNDETASKVLEVMLKEKTGRVTFMPLNRLKPKNPPVPNMADAIPLLEKLRFDVAHVKAFQQVFGKTCVCRDLTIAAAYVKSHGINTITLDGDKVDRKGALTGGYHDIRRSRINAIKDVTAWRVRYEEESKKSKDIKDAIVQLDQRITQLSGQMSVLTAQQNQIREARERLMHEGMMMSKEKDKLNERIETLEKDVQELETELSELETKISGYQNELKTPLTQDLSAEEEQLIENLGKEVEKRRKDMVQLAKRKAEVEGKKNSIEIELNERLRRRRDEIRLKLDALIEPEGDDSTSADDMEAKAKELEHLVHSISTLTRKSQAMDKENEQLTNKIQELQKKLEEVQNQQTEDSRNISRQQKTTERYLAKRQMLMGRKEECSRNIRDLGVLPEEAFERYTHEKLDRLVKKLHTVNEGLKKFAHVNKKAFEQYNNFTKQRDQLLQRREDLEKSAKSIEELVEVLDQRKDEAIERTFKQVASNFEEVFEKLVPAGRGRLIIQRRIDQDEVDEAEETQQSTIDNYTGIAIKVSFNSKVDEGLRIQQLSGGQKSLVALATVFAIQKCDPAPFYLFDEIDANLDAQYRTAVAAMIKDLASTAQFIVTTFRPEMLFTADKFYGVLFNNQKVSSIRPIKREEAMEFVDQEAQAR